MVTALFQTFEESSDPTQGAARAAALRERLATLDLAGFVVPRSDEHQNEYVPKSAERLAWLSGFSGSAGVAIVLREEAAIFVDGRYTLQVAEQVDPTVFVPQSLIDHPPEAWLAAHLKAGDRLGYDPWLHTPAHAEKLRKAVTGAGATLVPVEANPIDQIWTGRPADRIGAVTLYPAALAGQGIADKLVAVRDRMKGAEALLVSDPHALAWTFNVRGGDVDHTPLPIGFALIPQAGRPTLYLDARKLSNSVRAALEEVATVADLSVLMTDLQTLGAAGAKVLLDAATAPEAIAHAIEVAGGIAEAGTDPVALLKAAKNEAEQAGSRAAHRRDAAAVARFLHWFATEAPKGD